MFLMVLLVVAVVVICFWLMHRILSRTTGGHFLKNKWKIMEEYFHAHQIYKIPKFNNHMQQNQVYDKCFTYLNSLPSAEDSDFVNLFSGNTKPNEINLVIDDTQQMFTDTYLGSRIFWKLEKSSLVLKLRRKEKRRILSTYLQHIHDVVEEIELKTKQIKLYINAENDPKNGRWISVPFNHPATIDTSAVDADVKSKIKSDLESFLKSEQYYHRLGRVWKRSYLLHGPSGTGKSSFIAGMAKFLRYDIYDVDFSKVNNDSDLKLLLLQTTSKSMIVVEDLDRYLVEKSTAVNLSGILNFMDGIISSCGEERVLVFTVSNKDQVDPTVMRPGRIDVHVQFKLCDFTGFKTLANSHLGLKEHKLFPQVEEIFQSGASLSPAEIGEIMVSNRGSPTRALKNVINSLKVNNDMKVTVASVAENEQPLRLTHSISVGGALGVPSGLLGHGGPAGLPPRLMYSGSARTAEESHNTGSFRRESIPTVKEFKKFYGLLKTKHSKKDHFDGLEKENSQHEVSVF
ncbi:AAA-ATPase At2g46620-like [Rutidosis leptorrhynchoides]|uniref:AAA-ATPase At2g46620-like n=1 Tax=Rutidosis leptorrhynchoides TaxID=125765 RepID=UPI003A9A4FF1